MLLLVGLNSNNDTGHARNVWWLAEKQGYKCGIVLYRCATDVPITSGKFNYPGSHPDLKVVVSHVYNTYVYDTKNKTKLTRCYLYGCSLGA